MELQNFVIPIIVLTLFGLAAILNYISRNHGGPRHGED